MIVLEEANDAALVRFLDHLGAGEPAVLGYHYPHYREVLRELGVGEPYSLATLDELGELTGHLPGFRKRGKFGWAYCSLPFYGPNGMVLPDGFLAEARSLLERSLQPLLSISIYTPFLKTSYADYDAVFPKAAVTDKETQYLPLKDRDLDPRLRYRIRRAHRMPLRLDHEATDVALDTFYRVYAENCADKGIPPKPELTFRLIRDHAGERAYWLFAYQEERMVGALLALCSPLTASYYHMNVVSDLSREGVNVLLLDRCMQDLEERGVAFWNWEASPPNQPGVYEFKRNWGSLSAPYRIYSQLYGQVERPEQIAREYPYFFVYPFDRMNASQPPT